MKRFYKSASAVPVDGGFQVILDGRPVKTPKKEGLIIPTEKAAQMVALEWDRQGEEIDVENMIFARLANTAIDRVSPQRDAVVGELAGYGGSDLICYRATDPDSLVELQAKAWDPFVEFANAKFGAALKVTAGIMPVEQDAAALNALRVKLDALTDYQLAPVHSLVTGLGSLVMGLSLLDETQNFDDVWQAAQVEAIYQADRWGEDAEEREARDNLEREMRHSYEFLVALTR